MTGFEEHDYAKNLELTAFSILAKLARLGQSSNRTHAKKNSKNAWQRQNNSLLQSNAFRTRCIQEILSGRTGFVISTVVWAKEISIISSMEKQYTCILTTKHWNLKNCSPEHGQKSSRLTNWLENLAHFVSSILHLDGIKLSSQESRDRQPNSFDWRIVPQGSCY